MNQYPSNSMLPYINQLAIEADIPVNLARSMLGMAVLVIGEGNTAMRSGRLLKLIALDKVYVSTFLCLSELLNIPEAKLRSVLGEALIMADKVMYDPQLQAEALSPENQAKRARETIAVMKQVAEVVLEKEASRDPSGAS